MAETTERVLALLGLLQSRSVWSAERLGAELGVTTRTVRRDVERLRRLGYPVRASRGEGGGYQLGAGRALPPLLLDPQEAVAVAVALRLAAGATVTGVGDAALRALTKLDQVLPDRLRAEVAAVRESASVATRRAVTVDPVDPEGLMALARSCRDGTEARFGYRSRSGEVTTRRVEPYRLVVLGDAWYLLAYDLGREDWRSFRLDRMSEVSASTWRFTRRQAPDPEEYVTRSVTQSPYRHVARVRLHAPAAVVAARVPPRVGQVRPVDDSSCELLAGGEDLPSMAVHLAALDLPLEVIEPAALRGELARLGRQLLAAATGQP
ncbi:helix-turn-helix transcriptional regulator [Ornithinicoccus halotolerans]|uniref:helix-turn-helix transcriptional regulator n=1 Tax=Ornithinicoccus halotolerans TaxID=1748220 RepID=UPI00129636BA|nr:WYL domain-containing protein [Ornithinicoccus halotolerans]